MDNVAWARFGIGACMSVVELFSKRMKRLVDAGKVELFQYDELPAPFRVQVADIVRNAIGIYVVAANSPPQSNAIWEFAYRTLRHEKGVFRLVDDADTPIQQCVHYILQASTSEALDAIELLFAIIDEEMRGMYGFDLNQSRVTQSADDAINELNYRFREHQIGYQYQNRKLVRVDSQFIHADVVKPALALLNEAEFEGPEEEFRRAFEHHRHKRDKEAIAEASKALESTLKAICDLRGWTYSPNATVIPLLKIVFDNRLVPRELESHFAALRATLESGLPTVANKTSRHGQGAMPVEVPSHLTSFALHLCAANIVFLVQCHRALR